MRILLIGATGDVGRGILAEALEAGHSVTASPAARKGWRRSTLIPRCGF